MAVGSVRHRPDERNSCHPILTVLISCAPRQHAGRSAGTSARRPARRRCP